MKILKIFISILIIYLLIMFIIVKKISVKLDKETDRYTSLVGEEIILKNDTLLIIDYSLVNSTVILENKTEVNINLAEKIILK